MAKKPLPKASSGGKDVLMVNQLTVRKSVQFPELQQAVASATGGSSGGNGKNGKDETLTKDEFNSGFKDGVGQIKEGFAGLGAGLGPLQVVVDFVKGFVSKIGNIFTIFKGFFNILLSIPKAIANAFKKKQEEEKQEDKKAEKDKDKKDKKKQKKQDKKDDIDLKEKKKGRGGFMKFASALKPMLILGAILAISAGLIMLYNWLVGKGLFVFFDNLLTGIRIGLLDLKAGFALVFKGRESEEFRELEAEKAELILEKKVLPKLSEKDREFLASDENTAEAKNLRLQKLATREGGVSQAAVFRALSEKTGVVRETLQTEFNLEALDPLKMLQFLQQGMLKGRDLDTATVAKELELETRLATEASFTDTETVTNFLGAPSGEKTFGTRVFVTADGADLTLDTLLAELQKQDKNLTMEGLQQILASVPGVAIADDGQTIVQTGVGGADEFGRVEVERNESGDLETADIEYSSVGSALLDTAISNESDFGTKVAIGTIFLERFSQPISTLTGIYEMVFGRPTKSGEELDEDSLEAAGEDIINKTKLKYDIEDIGEDIQAEYIRDELDEAGIDGKRIGISNIGEAGKLRDQALIEDLARFSEVDGDASQLSYLFRRDAFEFADGTNMNSAEIEESLVTRIQSSMELQNRADAQLIYNTYMDNNQNMIQNIAPTSDQGQNVGQQIYLPDVMNIP